MNPSPREKTPWRIAVTVGFFVSIAGQWAINAMVDIIDSDKADLTLPQQALLCVGAVLTATGTTLIGRGTPNRPQGMDKWEAFWWGPVTIMFSAAVLLMSLLCVWVIPEAVKVYREAGASSTERPLTAVVVTVVVLIAWAISMWVIRYLRRSAAQHVSEYANAPVPLGGKPGEGPPIWAVALLIVVLLASGRQEPAARARP